MVKLFKEPKQKKQNKIFCDLYTYILLYYIITMLNDVWNGKKGMEGRLYVLTRS